MDEVLIVDLPVPSETVPGPWFNGYPVHQGRTSASLNYATLYAHEHGIRPDQSALRREFAAFRATLDHARFSVTALPFPEQLNQPNNLHHDALFLRDAGLRIGDQWIKARFSVESRQIEAEVHARVMVERFGVRVLELPPGSFVEFGEVFYLETPSGSYYLGGLGRSNEAGHAFVRSVVQPDHFFLIASDGYHLDTVLTPVINRAGELCAIVVVSSMVEPESLAQLRALGAELIEIDTGDASGEGEILGNYAVNALVRPGVLVNAARFTTHGVEERLAVLGVKRYVSPLPSFRWAGGSYHCLTNQRYS